MSFKRVIMGVIYLSAVLCVGALVTQEEAKREYSIEMPTSLPFVVTNSTKTIIEPTPKIEQPILVAESSLKSEPSERLVLEKQNIYVFNDVVTEKSVSDAMIALQKMDAALPEGDPLYLILDTPGGSIFAGVDFIEFCKGLGREVKTVTLFSASMGFQMVQSLGERLVVNNSILMSHRGAGGVSGQYDGELESRYALIKKRIDMMDAISAKRMDVSLEDYKKMIINEYWVHGFDAVAEKAADKEVQIKCGSSLNGSTVKDVPFIFGIVVKVTFSDCPLIRGPLKIEFPEMDFPEKAKTKELVDSLMFDKKGFFKKYVKTGEYKNYLK